MRLKIALFCCFMALPACAGPAADFVAALSFEAKQRGLNDFKIASHSDENGAVSLQSISFKGKDGSQKTVSLENLTLEGKATGVMVENTRLTLKNLRFSMGEALNSTVETLTIEGLSGNMAALLFDNMDGAKTSFVPFQNMSLAKATMTAFQTKTAVKAQKITTYAKNLSVGETKNGAISSIALEEFSGVDDTSTFTMTNLSLKALDMNAWANELKAETLVAERMGFGELRIKKADKPDFVIANGVMEGLSLLPGQGSMLALSERFVPKGNDSEIETKAALSAMLDLYSRFKIERFAVGPIKEEGDAAQMSIGGFEMLHYAKGGFEALTLSNVESLDEDKPFSTKAVKIGPFKSEKLLDLALRYAQGELSEDAFKFAVMTQGVVDLKRIVIEQLLTTDKNHNPLLAETMSLELGPLVGLIPSRIQLSLNRISGKLDEDKDELARILGKTDMTINVGADAAYDAASKTIDLKQMFVEIETMGRIGVSARIGNIDEALLREAVEKGMEWLVSPHFESLSLRVDNHGFMEATMKEAVKKKKTTQAALRKKMLADVKKLIAKQSKDKAFAKMLNDAAETFIAKPQGLSLSIRPKSPPLTPLMLGVMLSNMKEEGDKSAIFNNFDISVTAGP